MKAVLFPNRFTFGLSVLFWAITLIGISSSLTSCISARYDQTAVDYAKTLGDQIPALMLKATKKYSDNETEANAVVTSLTEAYDHAAAAPKNKDVAEQWRILRDDMVQPFLTRWEDKGKLDKDYIKAAADQVKHALASIQRAEKAKPKK